MTATLQVHRLEISSRPRRTLAQILNGLLFGIMFNLGTTAVNAFQFLCLLPLRLLPFEFARRLYDGGIRLSKGGFGVVLIFMCQCFAPTKLVVTFEKDGMGKFSPSELENLVSRDERGNVFLNLPTKSVLIANHQIYADWWYAWCLTYFMDTHRDVFIVLKNSLKWVPIVGWGMQFFNFIFLARSWASDRYHLSSQLAWLGQRAEEQDTPLTFILYPEGTLISENTKPISKKYADKIGIPDMTHTLLPRSTGLHYSLRSLAPRIPKLKVIDVTVAYPGVPALKYGQSYYTLRSIFFDRIPPPTIHMHIRCFDAMNDVPLGDMTASNSGVLPGKTNAQAVEVDIPEAEKDKFEGWLWSVWREKDILITKFLDTGSFVDDKETELEIPLKLRYKREAVDTYTFYLPQLFRWVSGKV